MAERSVVKDAAPGFHQLQKSGDRGTGHGWWGWSKAWNGLDRGKLYISYIMKITPNCKNEGVLTSFLSFS